MDPYEEQVISIRENLMTSLEANFIGPEKYLDCYSEYFYILKGTAETDLREFFESEPFPYLKVSV